MVVHQDSLWKWGMQQLGNGYWVSKVISELHWFCITSLSDWFKVLAPLFDQSEVNAKPIVARACSFSRALCRLRVITSSFNWFTGLSLSFLIGQSNYFGFGFTTLDWNSLYQTVGWFLRRGEDRTTLRAEGEPTDLTHMWHQSRGIEPRAILVGGECSQPCVILAASPALHFFWAAIRVLKRCNALNLRRSTRRWRLFG